MARLATSKRPKVSNSVPWPLWIVASLSVILLFLHLRSLTIGVYLTGDTVSYFRAASEGGPLSTFILHDKQWPPLTAITFNLLSYLALTTSMQHQLYVMTLFGLASTAFLYLVQLLFPHLKWQVLLIVLTLGMLGSWQELLFQAALSEPLLITVWLWSLVFLAWYTKSNRELCLAIWIGLASLLPLTRYLGAFILVAECLTLATWWSQTKKISWLTVVLSTSIAWVPIVIYAYGTKLQLGQFFPTPDLQEAMLNPLAVLVQQLQTVASDMLVSGGLLIGWGVLIAGERVSTSSSKKATYHHLIQKIIALCQGILNRNHGDKSENQLYTKIQVVSIVTTLVFYLLGLLLSLTQYRVLEYVGHRYVSVTYPILAVACIYLGKYLYHRLNTNEAIQSLGPQFTFTNFVFVMYLATGIFFISRGIQSVRAMVHEVSTPTSIVDNTEHTSDLNQICSVYYSDVAPITPLYLHPVSRNWSARAIEYYCPKVKSDLFGTTYHLERDQFLLSGYELSHDQLNLVNVHQGGGLANKSVYMYRVMQDYEWDTSTKSAQLGPLD